LNVIYFFRSQKLAPGSQKKMREFLVLFLIYILQNNECRGDLVEQRLAKELLKTDKYMKTVSPLDPT
jgi:hypothetical protein